MSDKPLFRITWDNIRASLVIVTVQLIGALLLSFAAMRGMISVETMGRGGMVLCGLGIAAVGNSVPKTTDGMPPRTLGLAALRQSVLRTLGRAMMLGGMAFAGIWAFAPLDAAPLGSMITLGASMIVGLGGVTWWIFANHRSPTR